jgi:hypothetical protein
MSSTLASTVFQGNSKNAMIVEDAYKLSNVENKNSIYDTGKGIFADAITGMKNNTGSVRDLAQLVMQSKTGTVDKTDMLNRALSAMGSSLPSLLGQLGGSLLTQVQSAAGTLIGDDAAKGVGILYKNAELLVGVADANSTEDLIKFINALAGNDELAKFVNIEAESAVIGAAASMLLKYDIPELVDDVIAQSQSDAVKQNAYAYLSSEAVKGSNLALISKSIDMIGLAAFIQNNPDAINQILGSFFLGTADTVDTYPAKRAELFALLVKINPYWDQVLVNGTYMQSLSPYIASSADAKKLFLYEENGSLSHYGIMTLASKGFQPRDVTGVIKDLYPNAYIPA